MNWRLKSKIQNMVALLPSSFSYSIYYWMQRHFGSLQNVSPINSFLSGLSVCERIEKVCRSPVGGVFLEVGTGRRVGIPLAFWLLGASKVTTVDVNPYLKEELVRADIEYIRKNPDEIERILDGRLYNDRLNMFLRFTNKSWRLNDLLEFCGIEYIAPADASKLELPSNSYDFYTSNDVFEHIPKDSFGAILKEGNRLIKKDGIFVHRIDYSDHFSYSDKSISPINFLQFSEEEWRKLAGNRYMYMNRLRVDDFCTLFQAANQKILLIDSDEDSSVPDILKLNNFKLDKQFSGKPEKVLATTGSWFITEKCG